MKYLILIIVGIAGVILGTYFGRKSASGKAAAERGRRTDTESKASEDVGKKRLL